MFTAKVKRLKEETVTFMELRDLEDLIITTMGEDVWLAILEFTQGKAEELESELEDLREESQRDEAIMEKDAELMQDIWEKIKGLNEHIDNAKRLDKRGLKRRLKEIDWILYNRL
ncbi:hypothetical protein [Clostridium sp.]|uniref:hypothetical protein n=1 Tax=Clostridium sp. TaxID=1506 RepID=UPI0035A0ACB5